MAVSFQSRLSGSGIVVALRGRLAERAEKDLDAAGVDVDASLLVALADLDQVVAVRVAREHAEDALDAGVHDGGGLRDQGRGAHAESSLLALGRFSRSRGVSHWPWVGMVCDWRRPEWMW